MLHPAIKPKRANLLDKTSIDGTSKCPSSVLTHDGRCTLVNRRRKNGDAGEGRIRSSLQSTHDNNLGCLQPRGQQRAKCSTPHISPRPNAHTCIDFTRQNKEFVIRAASMNMVRHSRHNRVSDFQLEHLLLSARAVCRVTVSQFLSSMPTDLG